MNIETMTLSDLEIIEPDLSKKFDDFWTVQNLKSELLNENSKCIVAKQDGEILGFASIWQAVDDVHITNIVVRKDLRNKGIGSILLEKIIKLCRGGSLRPPNNTHHITSITLEVKTTNEPAIQLYSKYGFEKVGLRKNYYNGTEDALIMTLK